MSIYGNTAAQNAWITDVRGVDDGYVITASSAGMWCNHIESDTNYAARFFADSDVTLEWTKFGGHTVIGLPVGRRNHFENIPEHRGRLAIVNDYFIYLHSATCFGATGYCDNGKPYRPGGGYGIIVIGENVTVADAEPVSAVFLGIPARNIRSLHLTEVVIVPAAYNASLLSNEISFVDSFGRMGMMCSNTLSYSSMLMYCCYH